MASSILSRVLTAVLLAVIFVGFVVRGTRTPPPRADLRTPLEDFPAERAMRHVNAIARGPHPLGSAEHDRVRDYIKRQIDSLSVITARGLMGGTQDVVGISHRYPDRKSVV